MTLDPDETMNQTQKSVAVALPEVTNGDPFVWDAWIDHDTRFESIPLPAPGGSDFPLPPPETTTVTSNNKYFKNKQGQL